MQFIGEYQLADTSICDGLIALFEDCRARDLVRRGTLGQGKVDLELKDSYDLALADVPRELGARHDGAMRAYFEALAGFLEEYVKRVPHLRSHTRPCHIHESPNIQYYPPGGGFFEEHFENGGPDVALRVLTFQTYLNDIEVGGGTRFVYQDHECTPRKGNTILWPAGFTHVHHGVVAPNEGKYIITGWWSFDK